MNDTEQIRRQSEAENEGKWLGILAALRKGLPPLLCTLGIGSSIGLGFYNHHTEQSDTSRVWRHSGQWTNHIEQLEIRLDSLEQRVNNLEQKK
jgi:hypothetical protein